MQSVSTPYRSTSDLTYNLDTYSRDGLGRITKVTHTDGTYSSAYYGAAVTSGVGGITTQLCSSATYGLGFPTLFVDEAQKKREVWTDGFGRTIEVDEPNNSGTLSQNTCYSYDVMNNLTGVTQGTQTRSYTYTYLYNAKGLVSNATTPESGTVGYTYGCIGNLSAVCTRSDARNVIAHYAYDNLYRLTGITYSGGTSSTPPVTYSYDFGTNQNGFRTGMIDGSGSTNWTNNAVGWVLTEQRTIANKTNTISYGYNLDGSIKSITYPSGRTVTYSISIAERAVSAIDSANNIQYALTASYAPVGALNSVIYGKVNSGFGGITETRSYNNRLEFSSIVASSAAGTTESLNFNYGTTTNNGTLSKITNNVTSGLTESFFYDYLNRVTSGATSSNSVTGCWGQSFGTTGNPPDDQWSNLTQINSTQCTTGTLGVGVSSATNRLSATGFGFDSAGNMTGDGTYTYTFDAENHLTQASNMAGGPWNYAYDGNGLRVEKSNGSGGTMYWRAVSGETIAESDLTGSTTNSAYREYIFFAGRRIASRDSATPTPNIYFYYTDHLGSTTAITTASGTVCYQANFTPYGEEHTAQATTCPQNYKFTGYERDNETQLDYAFARYYNSHLGRFMSADPMGGASTDPQSLNRYAYVGNSAVNFTDPHGMFKHPCIDTPKTDCVGQGGEEGGGCTVNGADASCGGSLFGLELLDGSIAQCPANYCAPGMIYNSNGFGYMVPYNVPGGAARPIQVNCYGPFANPTAACSYSQLGYSFQGNASPLQPYNPDSGPFLITIFLRGLGKNFIDEFKDGGCVAVFLDSLAGDAKTGGSPAGPQTEDVASAYGQGAAYAYAASKALSVPMRSSVYRDILDLTEDISGVIGVGALDISLLQAYVDEMNALGSGECR